MQAYRVEANKNQLLITIDKNKFNAGFIKSLLDKLMLESTVKKSKITRAQVDVLSNKIKSDWWEKNEKKIL